MGALGAIIVILSIGIGAAVFLAGAWQNVTEGKYTTRQFTFRPVRLVVAILIFIFGLTLNSSLVEVPAGHLGIVLKFGAVTGEVKQPGLSVIMPGFESVVKVSIQVQAFKAKAAAASKDLQEVSTELTLNFHLDAKRVVSIYQDIGRDIEGRIMFPAVQESVKSSTARYDAERLIVERPVVKDAIEHSIISRITPYGVIVDAVSITDFKFSKNFEDAIESKVEAQQLALKAENDLRRVKTEAEQQIARARAEAESLRMQREQASEIMVKLRMIEKWDGKMPQIMTGGNTVPMMDILKAGGR